MSLSSGTRLGPYEVLGLIGAGGMGEVNKARDTRLDRSVAIKVLPAELSTDPDSSTLREPQGRREPGRMATGSGSSRAKSRDERLARFRREAELLASLAHPHICTLHDIGEHIPSGALPLAPCPLPLAPVHYLIMEHLVGETLAERLKRGPVPLAQALEIAAQIAEALDAAHKHGIVHRDLKPGNVMLTTGGSGRSGAVSAKLLDFGLAKLTGHGERPALAGGATAPTMTAPLTERGAILGTLQYMAPEQLEGKEADARTDLWALGAILYEMVTGRRAFAGDSQVNLIGNIMNAEPAAPWTLQPLTPPALERAVKKCLAKNPDDRWDTAHDVADELRWIAQSSSSSIVVPSPRSTRRRWLALTGWAAATVATAILAALLAARFGVPGIAPARGAAAKAVAHLDIVLPSDSPFWIDPQAFAPSFALAPDGTVMAYTCARGAGTQLCLRRLDRSQASPMAGTERGRLPVFSPDGQWVLFCVAGVQSCEAGGAIKKLSVVDGRVDTPGTVPEGLPFLMTLEWSTDNRILLSGVGGIWTMPASGGAAVPLLLADRARGEYFSALPALLPDGQRMIFTVTRRERGQSLSEARVLTVATGEQRVVLKDAFDVRYLHTGHLLYQQGLTYQQGVSAGLLVVAPFDPSRLAVGPSVMLADPIRQTGPWLAFAVSQSGALLYLPYEADRVLTWVDRQQRAVPALQVKGSWGAVSLSPNGRRVAVEAAGARWPPGIAVVDLDRGIWTPLTSAGRNPLWTRDGTRIAFTAPQSDRILWQSSDGSGTPETLHTTIMENLGLWSPQGRLAFTKSDQATRSEIWTLSNEGPSWVPRRHLPAAGSASADSSTPAFSPDGRWVAYHGNESGTWEVYVRAYPGADQRTQISIGGGHDAVWSADGRELFYRNGDQFYAVPIATTPRFSAGPPRLLFTGPYLDSGPLNSSNYDVSPDGQRFLVVRVGDEERAPRRFHLVLNWFEELKTKVPTSEQAK